MEEHIDAEHTVLLEHLRSAKNVEKAIEEAGVKIATEGLSDDFRQWKITFQMCGYLIQYDYQAKPEYGHWGKSFGGLYYFLAEEKNKPY